MSDLLLGKSLVWASCDADNIVTAGLRQMLRSLDLRDLFGPLPVRTQLLKVDRFEDVNRVVSRQRVAFVIWVCKYPRHVHEICSSVAQTSFFSSRPRRICYLSQETAIYAPMLIEAGAQNVVGQLPSLQKALPRMLKDAPLSSLGYHPITSGLFDQLPWENCE